MPGIRRHDQECEAACGSTGRRGGAPACELDHPRRARVRPMSASGRCPRRSTTTAACGRRRASRSSPSREELGFRPNDLAQSLHRGQSLTVGLISTDAFGRFTIPIMEGVEECLSDSRMAVFMCNATDDPAREAQHVEQLIGKRVDGIVVTARRADQRARLSGAGDIPVIYVFSQVEDADACCLVPDDEGGAARPRGTSRARPKAQSPTSPARAVRGGAAEARTDTARLGGGGTFRDRPTICRACGRKVGAAKRWRRCSIARRGRPDAIFCGNDQIARGVADALRESRARRAGCGLAGRLRQLGDYRRRDTAAAHQRRHESRRTWPRRWTGCWT